MKTRVKFVITLPNDTDIKALWGKVSWAKINLTNTGKYVWAYGELPYDVFSTVLYICRLNVAGEFSIKLEEVTEYGKKQKKRKKKK